MPRLPRPTLKLIAGWRQVLRHAWSVRLLAVAALFIFLEVLLSLLGSSLPFPPIGTALMTALVTVAAFVARFVVQKDLSE